MKATSVALKEKPVDGVPFFSLKDVNAAYGSRLSDAVQRVVETGWFIMGPELAAFEKEFAQYCGVAHCFGVGNGLEAIILLLKAYDIGQGDEVIVPSNTFIATWLAVTYCGATPVPVEPDQNTFNITADQIRDKLTSKTKAIIPVHLYGQTADMPAIMQLANEKGIVVIEDAAQAQGALCHKDKACALGHAAATSFYPTKNLGALGDGGAVLTNDAKIAEKVALLRNYGSTVKYQHQVIGGNSRLDEMQAAALRVKLTRLDQDNQSRRDIADVYTSSLKGIGDIVLPNVPDWSTPVWHQYVIRTTHRDALQERLKAANIGTMVHYPIPPHKQACYPEFANNSLPITEQMSTEMLSLPISPTQTVAQTDYVIDAIKKFYA